MGVIALGTFFGDNSDATYYISEDRTTIKAGSTKSYLIWDHGRHERHFMHASSRMPELYLYVGHGYFKAIYTIANNFFSDKVHFAFSSSYSIGPQTSDVIHTYGPHVIPYGKVDLYGEEPHHQWYRTDIAKPTDKYSGSNPKPTAQVTWPYNTKPPAPRGIITPSNSKEFQLGMDLTYRGREGKSVAAVYEKSSADILTHTIPLEEGSKLKINDINIQLIFQPDFSNFPKNPLEYRNEVSTGLTLEEARSLARPRTLYPLHQEPMRWHHGL